MKDFWPGVTLICDSNKNRTNLAFEELNQVQPLSLTNVKTFVMGNFNSSIFNAFKKVLDSVSYLCVSNTSLDDNIANELVQCKNLRALNVSKTLISDFGILTLCGFRQTKSGETSYEIKASLFDIEIFDISNNLNVSKNCWQFLKGLPKLRILVTSYVDEYCPDVESFQKLLDLESLTCLCLDSSNSPGAVISALNTSDSNLKSLSYKFCELRDFDLLRLNSSIGFQNLSFLKMSSVFITDNGIDSVCKYLKNLIILDIGGCKNLTDVSLANIFQSLEKLKVLCVNGCNRMTATQLSKMREQSKDCVIKSDFPLSNPVLGKITEETLREVLFSYHFVTNGFSEIQNFSVI
ncbi:F-box/LRR-repeat protein 14 [Biomphalaria glabrata]|nr:F-box/LRR-repeat protein 14 [Biomphalaria glabrata]